ncbi:hypothetical protein CERSUDRAFT_127295 [Gelatoporia subvermispora B]|uniref:Uncharacterized protein n=1 Tax=Ceriporiopsis subvermispora (strain B) TaxID=914234 RepID=M2QHL0_CERS8|nr:hypothetical protein CERSUDRAFT_127295 [Gelatoporia subvermispora B]
MSFIHKTLQLLDVVVDSGTKFTLEDGVTLHYNLESLLLSLHFRCPELESLRFRGFFGTSIIDYIGRLRNLQNLFLVHSGPAPILDAASLVKLSHVASLAKLELYAQFDKPELSPITFSSLKQLILRGQLSSIVNLLSTIAAPSLVLLSVFEAKCHSTQECQNVFRIVANRFGQSLRIIRSTISLYNSEEEGARVLNVLESILDLHKIEEVHFHLLLWKSVIFGDDDVGIMARAWPWIRCLSLSYGSTFPMLPTARALGYLAAQCPNLTSVILPAIDFSEQGESNLHSVNYNMKHLRIRCVAHARTEDEVERAAKFVYQLFPQIDTIVYHQDNTYSDRWTRIMRRPFRASLGKDGEVVPCTSFNGVHQMISRSACMFSLSHIWAISLRSLESHGVPQITPNRAQRHTPHDLDIWETAGQPCVELLGALTTSANRIAFNTRKMQREVSQNRTHQVCSSTDPAPGVLNAPAVSNMIHWLTNGHVVCETVQQQMSPRLWKEIRESLRSPPSALEDIREATRAIDLIIGRLMITPHPEHMEAIFSQLYTIMYRCVKADA